MAVLHALSPIFVRTFVPLTLAGIGFLALIQPLTAQERHDKPPYGLIYLDFGGDLFRPRASSASTPTKPCPNGISTNFTSACPEEFSNVGSFSMAMGIRPIRYLQIDGLNVSVLGDYNGWGQRTSTFQCVSGCSSPTITRQTIGSRSALATTGGRFVLPLFRERLLVSGGAGVAWLWTNERVQPAGNQTVECSSCRHVGGHGPSEIVEAMYLFQEHVGIGFHARFVQIHSAGLTPAGSASNLLYGTTYKERFLLLGGEISIRFPSHH